MAEPLRVGMSGWIIQDGNYTDFRVGQQASFALEFYAPLGLTTGAGPTFAEWIAASRYHIRAQVIFATPQVWVIDTGAFMAFREEKSPNHAAVGSFVEGEIYLGIDPFFYFEYLHRIPGIPVLTYDWLVRGI